MKIQFKQIKLTGTRYRNGKRQQKTFMNTVNPFNKHANGLPKTYHEVLDDVKALVKAWKEETIT